MPGLWEVAEGSSELAYDGAKKEYNAGRKIIMKTLLGIFVSVAVIGTVGIISSLQTDRLTDTTVGRAVVELHITKVEQVKHNKQGETKVQDLTTHGVCSGSFIDASGDILTAGHCTADAVAIEVVTFDNKTYKAGVLATSVVHDLALLHIDRRSPAYFRAAPVIIRGEQIFILGSPLGISDTLSTGVIAKLGGDETLVDCGALPGNSGSPVYDRNYNMVGVLVEGYFVGTGTTHLNIAQSSDTIQFFMASAFRRAAR
jgi:S1-C subfamily serine protease